MFDTININLKSIDTYQLNFVETITRDLNVVVTETKSGTTTFKSCVDNLSVLVNANELRIGNGSLCKFLHGNNVVNFTRTDTRLAFEKLSDTLHISLNNATVSRMDVAYNFEVTYPPESYFYHLGNLPYYKRLEQLYNGVEGLYYSSVSDKKQLVFYDKIKETIHHKDYIPPEYQNKNLLRYELRLKNHIKQIFNEDKVTVPMLYDVRFYNRIVDYWRSVYRNIVKVNEYEIDIADCKGIRDLNKIGILLLVEQQGGMNEFFKKLDQQFKIGELDKRQLSEIKRQTKLLLQNKSIGVVRSPLIEELNTLVEGV